MHSNKKIIFIDFPVRVEMMGFMRAGNNPMIGMTVSTAVAVAESLK